MTFFPKVTAASQTLVKWRRYVVEYLRTPTRVELARPGHLTK